MEKSKPQEEKFVVTVPLELWEESGSHGTPCRATQESTRLGLGSRSRSEGERPDQSLRFGFCGKEKAGKYIQIRTHLFGKLWWVFRHRCS